MIPKSWKLARLKRQRATLAQNADHHRQHRIRLSLEAYYMDQFRTPLKWGRTQNAANIHEHHEVLCRREIAEIDKQIKGLQ